MTTIAFATCEKVPLLTADDRLAADRLRELGVTVEAVDWRDADADWTRYDAVVLRSTWDYHLHLRAFLGWLDRLERAGVRLWNPPALARWNVEKTYLRELAEADLPVVSTHWLRRGESVSLRRLLEEKGWPRAVVKPTVSADGYRTWSTSLAEAGAHQPELDEMLSRFDVMVQEYLDGIHAQGEWSLVFFDHTFSHAIHKRPADGDFRVQEKFGGILTPGDPPAEAGALARRVMERIPRPCLYARVDVVPTADGWCLLEVELVEPSFFLGLAEGAAERFAQAILSVLPPDSAAATFDPPPPAGTINFGVGQPSADLLPVDLLRAAGEDFLNHAQPQELNYGAPQGDERFRDSLAAFLSRGYGRPVTAGSLFVTAGASQALDYLCSLLTRPGETIFVEEPSYFLAFRIFHDHGLKVVGIPVDGDGLNMDRLEAELKEATPAFLYTIPSFHNPGGQTMSARRRKRLVKLSREHGFLIVADEVYQLLHYYDPPPAALGTMLDSGTVLSLGSFSKILAPGLRLGWVQTSPELMRRLLGTGVVNSGGCLNHFTSHVVRHAIELGLQQAHLERLRRTYRSRVDAMDSALSEHLGGHATWKRPDGGYFFWLKLDETVDAAELRKKAGELEVGFQPGELFSSCGGLKSYLRLSFAHYGESDIREGIARLKSLFG